MKEQIETAVPRRKFVAGDSDEARKTATGHSCKPLYANKQQIVMKTALIVIFSVFCIFESNAQISISKNKFKLILKESLEKSRNAVSDARSIWRFDNTNEDYFTKDTIILNGARSYRKDYCKEIRWSFYQNEKFVLENTPECTEPPTMLKPKKEDYKKLKYIEENGILYLIISNSKSKDDKFKVLEVRKNQPLTTETYSYDYSLILLRVK